MQIDWERIVTIALANRGKLIGGLIGLLLGWLTIRYGFWRALVFTVFVLAGLWIGAVLDREGWEGFYDRFGGRRR
ncbi:MAG TPA: DUF2273 domain-containing protein [Limnochordales bacterium]